MVRYVLIVLAAMLTACARQEAPVAIPQNTTTIGVAIGIGDEFYLDNLAHYGLGSTYNKASVQDWKLPETMETAVKETLAAKYHIINARLNTDKIQGPIQYRTMSEAFASGFAKTPAIYSEMFDSKTYEAFPADALGYESGADLYLVFIPDNLINQGTNQFYGIGLARRSTMMGIIHSHWLHTGYRLILLDGRTKAVLGSRTAKGQVIRSAPDAWWHETLGEISPQQQAEIRFTLQDMLTNSIRQTLADLDLDKR
ncbi:MAG: hypothetical protein CTR53_19935 [Ferrovibrio sp.]|nr:MAG: hypothetical protein CTR53_19935 [Ferrovibrio sp.]